MSKADTFTVPPAFRKLVKRLVASGQYRDAGDLIWDTLRRIHEADREQRALRKEIELGLADIEAGRYAEFDAEEIKRKGRQLLARRRKAS